MRLPFGTSRLQTMNLCWREQMSMLQCVVLIDNERPALALGLLSLHKAEPSDVIKLNYVS
jgi:hypothetical protein